MTQSEISTDTLGSINLPVLQKRLALVRDPELNEDIVSLGMVESVVDDGDGCVKVGILLTTEGCPLKAHLRSEIERVLIGFEGIRNVRVDMGVMGDAQRSELMSRARLSAQERCAVDSIPPGLPVIAVASGKGGVGKSTLSANLAAGLASRGHRIGILDADIWGFSIPRMLGVEDRLIAKNAKIVPAHLGVGSGSLEVVSMGLLVEREESALMWRGLLLAKALEQFLKDVSWGELDGLVIDMPPGTGDVQMALSRLLPQAKLVVVTTPNLAAQRVAARVADMASRSHIGVAGVVENMSAFVCDHGETYELFGSGGGRRLAEDLGVELLGAIPLSARVASASDEGKPLGLETFGPNDADPAATALFALCERVEALFGVGAQGAQGCTARLLDLFEKVPSV